MRIAVFIAGRGEKVFPGGPSGHHHGHRDEEKDGHEHDGADKQDNEYDGRLRMKMRTFFFDSMEVIRVQNILGVFL